MYLINAGKVIPGNGRHRRRRKRVFAFYVIRKAYMGPFSSTVNNTSYQNTIVPIVGMSGISKPSGNNISYINVRAVHLS